MSVACGTRCQYQTLWKSVRRSEDRALLQYNAEVNTSDPTPKAATNSHHLMKDLC